MHRSKDNFNEAFQKLLEPIVETPSIDGSITLKKLFEDRLQELGLSQHQVESMLDIERKSLSGILDGTAKRVDVINILKLGNFLNLDSKQIMNLYVGEMPSEAIGSLEQAKKSNFIVSSFDFNNLYKSKFLKNKNDFSYIESRIINFLGLENIYQYSNNELYPIFSRSNRNSKNKMREFWIKSAFIHFQKINNQNEYDRKLLVDLIPKIRPYTMNVEKGLKTVIQALFSVGVTVIYQPNLPTLQVRGATFLVDNKPCIVITDFQKSYPTIWFTLMHELYHVLYDLEAISSIASVHITGEPDFLLVNEDKANEFSREFLFSIQRSKYIAPLIEDEFTVNEYAKQAQVHPSFIYSFYCYDTNSWGKFKQHFPDVNLAIKHMNTNLWEKESIDESVQFIKETLFNF